MLTAKRLGSEARREVERELVRKLVTLRWLLRSHGVQTSKRLPSDDEEAAPLKSEMEIVESEERLESDKIKQIKGALERLKDGSYGICTSCHKPIPRERLVAMPESRYCFPCQRNFEKEPRAEDWPY